MALTAAIYGVVEEQRYNKILLLKPIISMDNAHDIGFLPGSMEEKLAPWMASYSDNIEVIMNGYIKHDEPQPKSHKGESKKDFETRMEKQAAKLNPMQELIAHGLLEVGSLQNIRGRSLPKQFIILDEGQNLTKHALKTVITRLGEGSKIVIMGDETQIDAPYIDSRSNALSICAEVFKESKITAHVTLKKSERSELAELATELL
jgi:PhoH-like ATPase